MLHLYLACLLLERAKNSQHIIHIMPIVDYYGLLWQWIIALSGLLLTLLS